ncbi:hypothetical protein GCM10011343_09690 [Flavobacterium orientale]|uniref:Uncharacterized protein n=2 Tax=Flavobacterium orientale TaxID=1756020 RepID=A0A917DB56_9FLAO|nr:hypothetical protein GCM10011343_09690 [Flavobacterium orientale]
MLTLNSCANKNYQYIENIKRDHNTGKENSKIILKSKNFNPSKKVFRKLNNISDDFIYIFSWVNYLPMAGTNHFRCLIYDRKSRRTFYVFNTLENTKSIYIDDNTIKFKEQKLILNYYLEKNIAALIALSPAFGSSEIGSEYYLFDSLSKEAFVIKNLVLNDDGEIWK